MDDKPHGVDTVYLSKMFTWKRYSMQEAVDELRLTYHPTQLNKPDAIVEAKIELNLRGSKKGRYLEEFSKMVPIWHYYDRGVSESTVLAFCSTDEQIHQATEAGALKAGGEDLIQEVAKGRLDVADVDFFVAHEDIIASMSPLVNILRDKMPRTTLGTVGSDMGLLVKTFNSGMNVDVKKLKPSIEIADEPDYGFCLAPIGTLDMEVDHLSENLNAVLLKLLENQPKRKEGTDQSFLTRCILRIQGQSEEFAQFSILSEHINDAKGAEQAQAVKKGQAIIAERVREIQSRS